MSYADKLAIPFVVFFGRGRNLRRGGEVEGSLFGRAVHCPGAGGHRRHRRRHRRPAGRQAHPGVTLPAFRGGLRNGGRQGGRRPARALFRPASARQTVTHGINSGETSNGGRTRDENRCAGRRRRLPRRLWLRGVGHLSGQRDTLQLRHRRLHQQRQPGLPIWQASGGRNYTFYTVYGFRRQYASFGNFIRKHNYVDLDYVYSTLSNSDGENPWTTTPSRPTRRNFTQWPVTPAPERPSIWTAAMSPGTISPCARPPAPCRWPASPSASGERLFFDGGMADPVPVAKAFADGCDKVVLILTKPQDTLRTPKRRRHIRPDSAPNLSSGGGAALPALEKIQRRGCPGQRV